MATSVDWFYWAVLSAAFAALITIFAKIGIQVAVFAFTFLGERPSLREWLGIAMVAGGVLVLAFKH